ncbi:MAG: glycosyltransferase, partial [Thermoplasmata archaeon]
MGGWAIDLLATAPASESSSGLSGVVWQLAEGLHRRGHRTRVLYPARPPGDSDPSVGGVEAVPVPVVGVRRGPYGFERAVARAASEFLDPSADLIVANDEKGGALVL